MQYKKNDIVSIKIEDIGTSGEGIGKIDGYTLFIKDAVIGDTVSAKIMKAKKNYAYARLEEVVIPSSFRIEPKCDVAKQCGGCQLQALEYSEQLKFKEDKVKNNLIRIGKFDKEFIDSVMEPIIGCENNFHYRNKAQFPIGSNKNNEPIAGFYAQRTHSIIPNTNCILGVPENEEILEVILSFMRENKVSAYNEETNKGLMRHVLIRKGFTTNQIMICIIINGNNIPHIEKLVDLLIRIEGIKSIFININRENTNVIMGNTSKCVWGSEYIEDYIGDIKFQISPHSFYQINPVQTKILYELALEYANLSGNEVVWDLYCGIGTISLFLSQKAKEVYGVEIIEQAILDARNNARINNITNATFMVGKAEEVLPQQYEENGIYADVIVVDPPRKGCDEKCLETMVQMAPEKIVYVSCDSATLARDLGYLCERGYEVKKVRAVDQFSQTVHVEAVCLLSKLFNR